MNSQIISFVDAGDQHLAARGLAALELQATAARAALPHLAAVQAALPGWLAALDVATDAGDLQQLVDLAREAPMAFALGMASERVAAVAQAHGAR